MDELGQILGPHDPFVEAIETSQGAHLSPLLIVISTHASTDGDSFYNWLDDVAHAKDPRMVSHVYTAAKDCELIDREAWQAANPAMGKFRSVSDIEDFAAQAEQLSAKAIQRCVGALADGAIGPMTFKAVADHDTEAK